jgi:hypothetical protein
VWRASSTSPRSPLRAGGRHGLFTVAAPHLQTVGERAGVKQIVVVSIIGIDRFPADF